MTTNEKVPNHSTQENANRVFLGVYYNQSRSSTVCSISEPIENAIMLLKCKFVCGSLIH